MDLDANQWRALADRDGPAAIVQLVDCFYERLYAFLRRLAGNDADAADLTQRTFGRAQHAASSFAGRSSVTSWLHGIAYHIYVDWRRANGRMEFRPDEWWAECAAREASPDQAAAQADLERTVYAAVDQLEPELRDTVHLHYYQGLTLQETADAMGLATSTIKYRLRQALAVLQKKLSGDRSGPERRPDLKGT